MDKIKDLGENIAVITVRKVAVHSGGKLDHLYKGLIFDYFYRNEYEYIYFDGYDVASNAMLFFCGSITAEP